MYEMEVKLKHPRGAIDACKVFYKLDEDLQENGEDGFRAWIYMGGGHTVYAEHQSVSKGSNIIESFYEYPDIQGDLDAGPRYVSAGQIYHRQEINSLDDWKAWLEEYVSGLDPRDAFRFYRDVVGAF